jgi:hypothetical protein
MTIFDNTFGMKELGSGYGLGSSLAGVSDPYRGLSSGLESTITPNIPDINLNPISVGGGQKTSSFLGMDKNTLGNVAGLAGAGASLLGAYTGYQRNKLDMKALQFNIDTAKAEQGRRNKNVAGFNSVVG